MRLVLHCTIVGVVKSSDIKSAEWLRTALVLSFSMPQQNCEFASFDLPGLLVLRRVAAPGLDRDAFQLVDLVDIHICIFDERAIKPAKQRLSR